MVEFKSEQIIGGNPNQERSKSDLYPTPAEVTISLLKFLNLPKDVVIWEPACGENDMVNVMSEAGYEVSGTDLKYGDDFLNVPLINCDWIITNPPFSLAEKFIERCIHHKKPFALLLKSQFWHSKRRKYIFDNFTPNYILPLTWRPNFLFKKREKASPLMDVMWVVWNQIDYSGYTYPQYIPLVRPENNRKEKMR